MQEAYDIHAAFDFSNEQDMRADKVLAIPGAHVIACACAGGIRSYKLDGDPNTANVTLRLWFAPT